MSTQRMGERVLTLGFGRWIVFDVQTGRPIGSGPVSRPSNMAFEYGWPIASGGGLAVVEAGMTSGGMRHLLIDVRGGRMVADLGAVHGDVTGVASDGSYAFRGGPGALTVWSPTGAVLARHATDGAHSFYATPSELRIVSHPRNAVTPRYEVLKIADGSARVIPPAEAATGGRALLWFEDGSHFVVRRGDRLGFFTPDYSLAQEVVWGAATTSNFEVLGGFGEFYFGKYADRFAFFRVRGSLNADGTPVPVLVMPWPASAFVGHSRGIVTFQLRPTDHALQHVDLRGDAPVASIIALPDVPMDYSFSADDQGNWAVVANQRIYASGAAGALVKLGCRAP